MNPQPSEPQSDALPIELLPPQTIIIAIAARLRCGRVAVSNDWDSQWFSLNFFEGARLPPRHTYVGWCIMVQWLLFFLESSSKVRHVKVRQVKVRHVTVRQVSFD